MRPVADEFVGNYVKVIHDFHSGIPGELTLVQDDIFKVTSAVDKNWLHGKNREVEGNFPLDFVEKINIPSVDSHQKVFAATENFPAQQDGDLEFRKGCIIIGLQEIDSNWWQGKIDSNVGIFPLTHVMELEISKLLRNRSKSVHSSEPLFAQALCDSVAQLDEELGFKAGDIITVTEVIDEDWYQGEVGGKSGMFLASCVQLLNEPETDNDNDYTVTQTHYNHSFLNKDSTQKQNFQTDYRTEQYNNDRTAYIESDNVAYTDNSNHTDEIQRERSISYTSENTKSHNEYDAGVTPYARTLYPFEGELANELSFDANDIVTLIQHIDEQWIEGELDGRIGLFPATYVEIVVDCPYAYSVNQTDLEEHSTDDKLNSESETENLRADSAVLKSDNDKSKLDIPTISEALEDIDEHFALVLFSFDAETNQDLSVREGETVTVIKQIGDNWVLVENEQGNRGMCPLSFVEIIGAIPEFTHKAQSGNSRELKTVQEKSNVETLVGSRSKVDENRNVAHSSVQEVKTVSSVTDINSETGSKPISAIKTSQSLDSIHSTQASSKGKPNVKPALKPKPLLAPKPSVKQKPPVSPRSIRKTFDDSSISSIQSEPSPITTSQKSEQTHSSDSQKDSIPKSNSMIELGKSVADNEVDNIENVGKGVNSGSVSSLPSDDSASMTTKKTESKKTFENWNVNQNIDNFIQSEFLKAAESRSRSGSSRSSSSGDSFQRSGSFEARSRSGPTSWTSNKGGHRPVSWAVGSSSVNMSPLKPQTAPDYSRSNFYKGSDLSVGNSTFFVNDSQIPKLRDPPPTPVGKEHDAHRKPSLRKAAPPRPTGPRIAPVPSRTPLSPEKLHSKPVPSRPAPAKPQHSPSRPAGSRSRQHVRPAPPTPQGGKTKPVKMPRQKEKADPDNLMSFSPTNTAVDSVDIVDSEAVAELKLRITQMETDLESCKKSKAELELMEQNVQNGDTTEIHENIQFYTDNIQGITVELELLKDNLALMCPKEMDKIAQEKAEKHRKMEEERKREEMRKKLEQQRRERREKREKVIEEMVQTEKDFLTSLSLIMETFLGPGTERHPEVDIDHLFGNIEEVADVSQRLLTKLEEALNGKDFDQQVIGTCFISLAEDMKNVYAPYCRNHDDVITLIEKYNQTPDIKDYLERLLDKLRERHVVFDLEALLIKPVQRILKYPLLLNALIKATEDNHPDKAEILQAINAMTDVATAINEYKRRKDLVYKYKKDAEVSLGDKLSKLSLHSIKKKSSRIKERFSVNLGFIDQMRDEVFDKEESRYRSLEKVVRVFVKDVQTYMDQVVEIVTTQECMVADIEDYYLDKRGSAELQKYQESQNKIQGNFLPEFKEEVDSLVLQPLSTLLLLFEAPNKVIQKRYHKLLDYGNLNRKAKDDKLTEKAAQIAKQDYEALNAQLLDELPTLYKLAFQLFKDCVASLVQSQRQFTDKIVREMYSLLDLQILTKEGVIEVYNIKHVTILDRLAMLSFMPKSFSPKVAEQKAERKSKKSLEPQKSCEVVPQIDSQRIFVTQQYPANKLFKVNKTYVVTDMMDISLSEGDIVGVIMEKDPMGNKDRWFVDNGAQKGFVPKKVLTQYDPTPPRNPLSPPQYQTEPVSPPPAYSSVFQNTPNQSNQAASPYFGQQTNNYQYGQDTVTPSAEKSSPYRNQSPGSVKSSPRLSTGSYHSPQHSAILPDLQEDEMDFALEEDMTPAVPEGATGAEHGMGTENPAFYGEEEELELYYAEYAFTARNTNEISLFEHQVVTVLHKHDQEGNPEWWYVDADGTYGYAPASYLKQMDSHGDPT